MRKSLKQFEVQTPLVSLIGFENITWSHSSRHGFGNAIALVHAYIPYERVHDLINGQTCEDGSTDGWNIKDRKKGEEKKRPYILSLIEHVWYECAYGPKDYRNDHEYITSKKCGIMHCKILCKTTTIASKYSQNSILSHGPYTRGWNSCSWPQ